MQKIIRYIKELWQSHRYRSLYVTADPQDTSITLSTALVKHMGIMDQKEAKVLMTWAHNSPYPDSGFCFTLNPDLGGFPDTQLCEVQYNTRYHTVGFETLIPTVARIFYDYRITPPDKPCKLPVRPCRMKNGRTAYFILRTPIG